MRNMNYQCQSCDKLSSKWSGQCHHCKQWNSLTEISKENYKKDNAVKNTILLSTVSRVINNENKEGNSQSDLKNLTGIAQFDKTLSGGLVRGSLCLLFGEPGIGKTTLMTQVCIGLASSNKKVLYISGEESSKQVAMRFKRLSFETGCALDRINLLFETKWKVIKEILIKNKPDFLLLDSIQTTIIECDTFQKSAKSLGSVTQIKHVVFELMQICKKLDISTVLIGHINKEGSLAGPKALEHMVDTSIILRSIGTDSKRELGVLKNRFGSHLDSGLFTMTEKGLVGESESSSFYLSRDCDENDEFYALGKFVAQIISMGRRIFCEVQSLCVKNNTNSAGVRVGQGIERRRFLTLIAIVEKYLKINLSIFDIYVEVRAPCYSTCLDLAVVGSILGSYYEKHWPRNMSFQMSELNLSGEFTLKDKKKLENSFRNIRYLDDYIKKLP